MESHRRREIVCVKDLHLLSPSHINKHGWFICTQIIITHGNVTSPSKCNGVLNYPRAAAGNIFSRVCPSLQSGCFPYPGKPKNARWQRPSESERSFSYHFVWANQWKVGIKFFSWTQYAFCKDRCNWHILAGNDWRIKSHNLIRSAKKDIPLAHCPSPSPTLDHMSPTLPEITSQEETILRDTLKYQMKKRNRDWVVGP